MSWLDPDNGMIVGTNGQIFLSSDGGNSWTRKSQGFGDYLGDVYFTDDVTGFLVTGYPSETPILKTTDGGDSWYPVFVDSTGYTNHFKCIRFYDQVHGLAAGGTSIFKTDDHGNNWSYLSDPDTNWIFSLAFSSSQDLWVGCDMATLLHSPDNGITWERTTFTIPYPEEEIVGIIFPDASTGYVLAGIYENYTQYGYELFKSVDGGDTWDQLSVPGSTAPIIHLCFPVADTGYFINWNRQLYGTHDGGESWTLIDHPFTSVPSEMQFFSSKKGLMAWGRYKVAITNDGGLTWEIPYDTACLIPGGRTYYFLDQYHGWQVGPSGFLCRYNDHSVGIEDPINLSDPKQAWQIFPNPTSNHLTITPLPPSETQYLIFDQTGREVSHGIVQASISVKHLAPGLYYLQLSNPDTRFQGVRKFVKN
jgi:photosystem II stability/assembly factor-like uncharacterized protein